MKSHGKAYYSSVQQPVKFTKHGNDFIFKIVPLVFRFRIGSINGPERPRMFVDPRCYSNKYNEGWWLSDIL